MRKIRLVTYTPLCYNLFGIKAIRENNLSPFIDGSCRREPDLEHDFPSITALCRKAKLAPQLKKGDIVIYLSKPRKYQASEEFINIDSYKLVAILRVIHTFKNHVEASIWYTKNNLVLPNNCMIKDNPPTDFSLTVGKFKNQNEIKKFLNRSTDLQKKIGCKILKSWNNTYQEIANKYPHFNVTERMFKEIDKPINILKSDLIDLFGYIPRTQTPKIIIESQYECILNFIKKYPCP